MQDVIIFGTGKEGENAFWTIRMFENVRLLFWVDNDKKKWGGKYFGREIFSPDVLKDYTDVQILIACYDIYGEIYEQLKNIGMKKISGLGSADWNRRFSAMTTLNELNSERCIDLKRFLKGAVGEEIVLKELPHSYYGESGVLDYAFLFALGKKYNIQNYLEVGTNIGTSINIISEFANKCYSITAPIQDDEINQKNFCRKLRMPDYSERLATNPKIEHFYGNSQVFDYAQIPEKIDLYFIDADHSYNGVYNDTNKIFEHRDEDSFVVWHDFQQQGDFDGVVLAVKDALQEKFENVFIVDNNICAVYIPKKYQKDFPYTVKKFVEAVERPELCVYDTILKMKIVE